MEKSKIWYLAILILALNLSGCKKILLMHYQVKKPKIENSISLNKFIEKNELQSKNHFTFSYQGFNDRINDLSFPGIEIYTKDGKYIPYPGEESCKGGASEFIEILKNPLQFPTSDSLILNNLTKELRTIDGKDLYHEEIFNFRSDFVVVIYWAKFAGKLNSRDINGWKQNIKNNSNSKFDVLMVNCDFQEWWGEDKLSQMGLIK